MDSVQYQSLVFIRRMPNANFWLASTDYSTGICKQSPLSILKKKKKIIKEKGTMASGIPSSFAIFDHQYLSEIFSFYKLCQYVGYTVVSLK